MAASSDSSDEDMEKFAAIAGIVDAEVVKFNGNSQASSKSKLHTALKPSLRHWQEDEDAACSTSELITPEFRHHVAKKLAKFLDSNYVCTQEVQCVQNGHHNSPHDQTTGIKLLLSSSQRLLEESGSDTKEMPSYTARRKKEKKYSSSSESGTDEEELNRLAEAAVSGYSIIQKAPNGNREEVEDESSEMSSLKRKKEKKLKKEKKKKEKLDEEVQKKSKHKKHKKEKHKT